MINPYVKISRIKKAQMIFAYIKARSFVNFRQIYYINFIN